MKRMALVFAAVFCLFVGGCGAKKDLANTESAVVKFHAQLDAGSFDQIYADSGAAMKKATSQQKLVDLLSAIHRKLGNVKNSNRQKFFMNWGTAGKTVRVNYATQFDADSAEEEFAFLVDGDDVKLVGYHINSEALVTK
jgi:hypothetical protein